MILSVVAIVLSVLALASHFLANPLGSGISGYDLTTPKAALESMLRIVRDQNPMAQIEMEYLRSSPRAEEKLETLKVHRDAEYGVRKYFLFHTRKMESHSTRPWHLKKMPTQDIGLGALLARTIWMMRHFRNPCENGKTRLMKTPTRNDHKMTHHERRIN